MVISGWTLGEIAKHIQHIKGESTDITEDALLWALGDYRKELPPGILVQKSLPAVFTAAAKKVAEGLDVLAEMEALFQIQMKRVNIDLAMETTMNKLLPTMTGEIRMAKDILNAYSEMQMDLGLVKRQLGTVDVDAEGLAQVVSNYGKESVKEVLSSPQSRRKLLGLVDRFMIVQKEREKLEQTSAAADTSGNVIDMVGESEDSETPAVAEISGEPELIDPLEMLEP